MHILMIAYYTGNNLNCWKNIWGVGYHITSWKTKMMDPFVEQGALMIPNLLWILEGYVVFVCVI